MFLSCHVDLKTETDYMLHVFSHFFQHIQAVSGAFMDSQHNGNTPLQTSTSNLNAILPKPAEKEEEDETIWLWVAVIATVGNIVVVAVVCACAF